LQVSETFPYLNFFLYTFAVLAVVASMIIISFFLGGRHKEKAMGEPYESGIVSTGSARLRFSAQFYIVAVFFVIFDLEAVFIIAWAIAFRELSWFGFWGITIFIGILLVILIYEWRNGALDFAPSGKNILKHLNKKKSGDKQ
jgi:NADH-quinone oxidoreductase subunit A